MSLRTRINGFTSWVNLRLIPQASTNSRHSETAFIGNVITDILRGTNMKSLLRSMTGTELGHLQSFEGLSDDQKRTRIQWTVDELKRTGIISDDVFVDTRMFAMRSAQHIFDFLWRLVVHDIYFIWERAEFLQLDEDEILAQASFKWVPETPPAHRKTNTTKANTSLLAGFSAVVRVNDANDNKDSELDNYKPFPSAEFMKSFKFPSGHEGHETISIQDLDIDQISLPSPEQCIIKLVLAQLASVSEGRVLKISNIGDLADSRVLCALVNSFVPETFASEILLNDRWTINLVLRSAEKMFGYQSVFDSQDLYEADLISVCAYFTSFFMLAYKYRQSFAVVARMDYLNTQRCKAELDLAKHRVSAEARVHIQTELLTLNMEIASIKSEFNLKFCCNWIEHVQNCVTKIHETIRTKFEDRFEVLEIPRNISIRSLCISTGINLILSRGNGFYLADSKEMYSEQRRVVLQEVKSRKFHEDFNSTGSIAKMLKIDPHANTQINPKKYKSYKIFFEALSKNKKMKVGSTFLYKIFPGDTETWQKSYLIAIKENDIETVKRFVAFFSGNLAFINCCDSATGNSGLHYASKLGHSDILLYLLENGAEIDAKNKFHQTPFFLSCDNSQKLCTEILLEWGCDVHIRTLRGELAFEAVKNVEARRILIGRYEALAEMMPRIVAGDTDLLRKLVDDHKNGVRKFANLRSRCVNGSTLLHAACYFGLDDVVTDLLALGVQPDICDYKQATPLHRASQTSCIKLLLTAGARANTTDMEGNTALHVRSYGETGHATEIEAISMLLEHCAKIGIRNSKKLTAIHCAALQGRLDAIKLLIGYCRNDVIDYRKQEHPPSVVYLSIANDHIETAEWLVDNGFKLKVNEADRLLKEIINEQFAISDKVVMVSFVLGQGADINKEFENGNSALHDACQSQDSSVVELLLDCGANLEVRDSFAGNTPLAIACAANNKMAASLLISYGANVRSCNINGLTPFDNIVDQDEWIKSGFFGEEINARLKAYSLKHSRELIRAITRKIQAPLTCRDKLATPPLTFRQTRSNKVDRRTPSTQVGLYPTFQV